MIPSKICLLFLACGAGLGLGACEKKPAPLAEATDAGVSSQAAVDPALAKAVAAASAAPSGARAGKEGDGPPENGVFAPGRADRELVRGGAPKITTGPTGTDPRVALIDMQPKPGKYPMRVRVQSQQGGRGGIPVDFRLSIEVTKPKAESADAGSTATAAASGALLAVAKVASAELDATLVPNAPPELAPMLAKLKGSSVSFFIAPSGAGSDFKVTVAKGVEPELESALRNLSDALAAVAMPYPAEPVGVGAFWGATTRENVLDIDTLAYRLMKVAKVEGNVVTLQVEAKRYATDASQRIPGLAAEGDALELKRFEAQSSGSIRIAPGSIFPVEAELSQMMGALASLPGQPQPVLLQEKITVVVEGQAPVAGPGGSATPVSGGAPAAPAAKPAIPAPAPPAPAAADPVH